MLEFLTSHGVGNTPIILKRYLALLFALNNLQIICIKFKLI